jgi:lysophospholipase L1-like esterase
LTFNNSTLRQTVRVSTGGQYLRFKITNAFGASDLQVSAVTVALPRREAGKPLSGSKVIVPDTIRNLTFNGHTSVDVPTAALVVSDPIEFAVESAQVITVTIFLRHGQSGGQITSHPGSRTESWISHGDHTKAEDLTDPSTRSTFHWYFLSGIEAWQQPQNCAFALVGDSITDGRCSTDNFNDRWPDLLLSRMMEHPFARNIAVLNQAAGGNRILTDDKGPNVLSRLDRDLFAQAGVKYVMIFHGVNDIGTADSDAASQEMIGDRLIQAYKQIATRVHAFGIPVFCSTITPFGAPDPSLQGYSAATREQTRQRINNWLRTSGAFDAVIDFDAVIRDPSDPSSLHPNYNSGDYLHPNVEAFTAMARSFPLDIFEKFANGVHTFD